MANKTTTMESFDDLSDPLLKVLSLMRNLSPPPLSEEQRKASEYNRMLNEKKYGKGNEFDYFFDEEEDEEEDEEKAGMVLQSKL